LLGALDRGQRGRVVGGGRARDEESVPAASHRLDEPWTLGVVVEGGAQLAEHLPQGVAADDHVRPDGGLEAFLGDEVGGPSQQLGQRHRDLVRQHLGVGVSRERAVEIVEEERLELPGGHGRPRLGSTGTFTC
jgi:hypothetical protein